MSDPNQNPTYEAPTITITGYDDSGVPVLVGHADKREVAIPEPPITLEDTGRFDLIQIEPEQARTWRDALEAGIGAIRTLAWTVRGDWQGTMDMLQLAADQIDQKLSGKS